jgi:hypothetical protein
MTDSRSLTVAKSGDFRGSQGIISVCAVLSALTLMLPLRLVRP